MNGISNCPDGRATCKGHKYYHGGIMDGTINHLCGAHPTDYPRRFGTVLRNGQRSWYERETDPNISREVVYRFIGLGRECPVKDGAK